MSCNLDFWDFKLSPPITRKNKLWLTINNATNEYLDKSSDMIIKIIFLKAPDKMCVQGKYYSPNNFRKICFS